MIRIGMLSTWKETCGVARNAHSVADLFEGIAEIVPLPLQRKIILGAKDATERKLADLYFASLMDKASSCDILIWQHEPGLLGGRRRDYLRRSKNISNLKIRTIVVLHTIPRNQNSLNQILGIMLSLSRFYSRGGRQSLRKNIEIFVRNLAWGRLFNDIKRIQKQGGQVIIHNQLDADYLAIKAKLSMNSIEIAAPSNLTNEMHQILERASGQREQIDSPSRIQTLYSEDALSHWIAYVGFINDYKGIDYLIKLAKYLPDNYRIIIAGNIHERSADDYIDAHPMTKLLLDEFNIAPSKKWDRNKEFSQDENVTLKNLRLIQNKKILEKFKFISDPSDAEIAEIILGADAVSLLYRNVQQSASGPLVETLELGGTAISSNNRLFRTFKHLAGDQLQLIDVGNILQARDSLLSIAKSRKIENINNLRIVTYPWSVHLDIRREFAKGYVNILTKMNHENVANDLKAKLNLI